MRAIKTSVIPILAVGMLAVSTVGVAGQDEAAVFTWDTTPGEAEGTGAIEASDTRASGALTIGLGEALVTDELVLGVISLRLVNDEGVWIGTGRTFGGDEMQGVTDWTLTGEGIEDPWGVIVATDAIPPYPNPPPSSGIGSRSPGR